MLAVRASSSSGVASRAQLTGPARVQYSVSDYRDKLYLDILRRKKELRRKQHDKRHSSQSAVSHSRSGGSRTPERGRR